jgi:GntR family transcriptional regulator
MSDNEGVILAKQLERFDPPPTGGLPKQVAAHLREKIARGDWKDGERFPTETALVESYGVSRSTIREALKQLLNQGLIYTQRGKGSFVATNSLIKAGMQDLLSITSTIENMGMVPKMIYHHKIIRGATEEECERFNLESEANVVDIQRKILADGVTVCYSYDVLPRWVFPNDFRTSQLTGSVFAYLADNDGPTPLKAFAEVHAVNDRAVAWDDKVEENQLFVLLDQIHYDQKSRPFMHTKGFFVEGKFNFSVVRTAPFF